MRARSGAATMLLVTFLTGLTACSASSGPSYAEVRAQAEDAVAEIVAALPDGAEFRPDGGSSAQVCDSEVSPRGRAAGEFATVHGAVSLPEGVDAATTVTELPVALGDGWALEPAGVDLDIATVRLSRAETNVSVDITESTVEGRPGLDLLAVSECGSSD
ncbi:hypothetical protein ACIGEP_02880 [Microbacterium sp. NPDC077663]|uniref:hypothetical protein n=1 Tax=Microbacterium sp. NPDC077663 TaxID=3364189 RepID=UPI0037CCACA0